MKQMEQKDLPFIPSRSRDRARHESGISQSGRHLSQHFFLFADQAFRSRPLSSGEKPTPFQIFDRPGLVTLRCDIHEHMRGLVLVLDTPYFTMTDPQGLFA